MSDLGEFLTYDDELIDDDPVIIVPLSSHWVDFVLAVVAILKQEDLWLPHANLSTAMRQVDELLVRLMGADMLSEMLGSALPITFSGGELDVAETNVHSRTISDTNRLIHPSITATNSPDETPFARFECPLNIGDYEMVVICREGSANGKWSMDELVEGEIFGVTDNYATTVDGYVTKTAEFSVTSPHLCKFTINREGKNASSGGYYIRFETITIRRVGDWT